MFPLCAAERTRTSTPLPGPAPQAGASTNSATTALCRTFSTVTIVLFNFRVQETWLNLPDFTGNSFSDSQNNGLILKKTCCMFPYYISYSFATSLSTAGVIVGEII